MPRVPERDASPFFTVCNTFSSFSVSVSTYFCLFFSFPRLISTTFLIVTPSPFPLWDLLWEFTFIFYTVGSQGICTYFVSGMDLVSR